MSELITPQSVFNAAWQKFIVEDARPATKKNQLGKYSCSYLTEDGRRCAIGLCIPSGHKTLNSGREVEYLAEKYPELFSDGYELDILQTALHDDLIDGHTGEWKYSKEERKAKYIKVAKKQGLEIPV